MPRSVCFRKKLHFLLLRISFPGRPIFIQLPPGHFTSTSRGSTQTGAESASASLRLAPMLGYLLGCYHHHHDSSHKQWAENVVEIITMMGYLEWYHHHDSSHKPWAENFVEIITMMEYPGYGVPGELKTLERTLGEKSTFRECVGSTPSRFQAAHSMSEHLEQHVFSFT